LSASFSFMKKYSFPLFFLIFYFVWIVRATWFYSAVDLSIASDSWRLVFSIVVKFILWVIPVIGLLIWFDKENPLSALAITTSIKWKDWAFAFGVSVLYFVVVFVVEYFTSHRTLLPLMQAPPSELLSTLITISFSPIVEELLFRGYVLHKLEENFSFRKANLLQAFLFTAMHLPNWIWTGGLQISLVATSLGVFLVGLLLGWVRKQTNSIFPPILVHIVNNFLAAFLN